MTNSQMESSALSGQIPETSVLKAQAKALRADMAARGAPISHAQALETVAHQWGARDWNTAVAQSARAPISWTPGQRVKGRYLGHAFHGAIKAARVASNGMWSVTVRFDQSVDVVASAHFTSLRRQVHATLGADGTTTQKTSDGVPHMRLESA